MGLIVGDGFGERRSEQIISISFEVLNVTMTSFGQGKSKEKLQVTSWKAKLANYLLDLPNTSDLQRSLPMAVFCIR